MPREEGLTNNGPARTKRSLQEVADAQIQEDCPKTLLKSRDRRSYDPLKSRGFAAARYLAEGRTLAKWLALTAEGNIRQEDRPRSSDLFRRLLSDLLGLFLGLETLPHFGSSKPFHR